MFDRSPSRAVILGMAAQMKNEAKQRLGYREDEIVTETEREYMNDMIRKKEEMEALVRLLIFRAGSKDGIYRRTPVARADLKPVYDFLFEMSTLIENHECRIPSPSCWAQKLVEIHGELVDFMGMHEILFVTALNADEQLPDLDLES